MAGFSVIGSFGVGAGMVILVSTLSLMVGITLSLVGVTASALGGVRLKKLLSMPTAGGRPRGKRKLSDALARFSTRQSDITNILFDDSSQQLSY